MFPNLSWKDVKKWLINLDLKDSNRPKESIQVELGKPACLLGLLKRVWVTHKKTHQPKSPKCIVNLCVVVVGVWGRAGLERFLSGSQLGHHSYSASNQRK